MKNCKTILISVSCAITLSGCAATGSQKPDPTYVSPSKYEGFNCKQINAEKTLISSKIEQASKSNDTNQLLNAAVSAFAISQGYGYGDDNSNQELSLLKNEQDVLDQAAIKKQCNL